MIRISNDKLLDDKAVFQQFVIRSEIELGKNASCGFCLGSSICAVINSTGATRLQGSRNIDERGSFETGENDASHELVLVNSVYGTWVYIDGEQVIAKQDTHAAPDNLIVKASGICTFTDNYLFSWSEWNN